MNNQRSQKPRHPNRKRLVSADVTTMRTPKLSLYYSCKAFFCGLNYNCLKRAAAWIVDRASFEIRFGHIMFLVTIFALFGDDVKIMTTYKDADYGFYIADMVCVAFFLLETIIMSWTKTTFTSFYPVLRFEGYILSVNFLLDIVVILSLFIPVYLEASLFFNHNYRAGIIVRTVRWYGKFAMLYRNFREGLDRFKRNDMNGTSFEPMLVSTATATPATISSRRGSNTGSSGRERGGSVTAGTNNRGTGTAAVITPQQPVTPTTANGNKINGGGSGGMNHTYSSLGSANYNNDYSNNNSKYSNHRSNNNSHNKQSKLGSQLTDAITLKVVMITLIMLLVLPLTFYNVEDKGAYNYTSWLHSTQSDSAVSMVYKEAFLEQYLVDMSYQPMYLDLGSNSNSYYLLQLQVTPLVNDTQYIVNHPYYLANLRSQVLQHFNFSTYNETEGVTYITSAVFSLNSTLKTLALFNLILTLAVCFLLVAGATIITQDVQRLVLSPIERMVDLVERVSKHPLARKTDTVNGSGSDEYGGGDGAKGTYETRLLESTLDKITALLRVGFGEAGSGIISANLGVEDTSYSSVIKALIPGIRVYAIVGFCDIHHFEDVEDRLKKDILTFVNSLAEIVHSTVQHWGGQCNKNLGNAFVVIWRIGDEDSLMNQTTARTRGGSETSTIITAGGASNGNARSSPSSTAAAGRRNSLQNGRNNNTTNASRQSFSDNHTALNSDFDSDDNSRSTLATGGSVMNGNGNGGSMIGRGGRKKAGQVLDLRRIPGIDEIADRALIAYLKVIAEINRNRQVLSFRTDPRLTRDDTEQYKVRMGFGLHVGWAIEGAVGSDYKVDATYLSPHVNMAARLETASRQYGVPLLLSQNLYDLLSTEGAAKCRKIDVVTVKGSEVPMGVFTYDALQEQVFPNNEAMFAAYGYNFENMFSFSSAHGGNGSANEENSNKLKGVEGFTAGSRRTARGGTGASGGLGDSSSRNNHNNKNNNNRYNRNNKKRHENQATSNTADGGGSNHHPYYRRGSSSQQQISSSSSFNTASASLAALVGVGRKRTRHHHRSSLSIIVHKGVDVTGSGVAGAETNNHLVIAQGVIGGGGGVNKFTTNSVAGTAVASKMQENFQRTEFQYNHDNLYRSPSNHELIKVEKSSTKRFRSSVALSSPVRFHCIQTPMSPLPDCISPRSSTVFTPTHNIGNVLNNSSGSGGDVKGRRGFSFEDFAVTAAIMTSPTSYFRNSIHKSHASMNDLSSSGNNNNNVNSSPSNAATAAAGGKPRTNSVTFANTDFSNNNNNNSIIANAATGAVGFQNRMLRMSRRRSSRGISGGGGSDYEIGGGGGGGGNDGTNSSDPKSHYYYHSSPSHSPESRGSRLSSIGSAHSPTATRRRSLRMSSRTDLRGASGGYAGGGNASDDDSVESGGDDSEDGGTARGGGTLTAMYYNTKMSNSPSHKNVRTSGQTRSRKGSVNDKSSLSANPSTLISVTHRPRLGSGGGTNGGTNSSGDIALSSPPSAQPSPSNSAGNVLSLVAPLGARARHRSMTKQQQRDWQQQMQAEIVQQRIASEQLLQPSYKNNNSNHSNNSRTYSPHNSAKQQQQQLTRSPSWKQELIQSAAVTDAALLDNDMSPKSLKSSPSSKRDLFIITTTTSADNNNFKTAATAAAAALGRRRHNSKGTDDDDDDDDVEHVYKYDETMMDMMTAADDHTHSRSLTRNYRRASAVTPGGSGSNMFTRAYSSLTQSQSRHIPSGVSPVAPVSSAQQAQPHSNSGGNLTRSNNEDNTAGNNSNTKAAILVKSTGGGSTLSRFGQMPSSMLSVLSAAVNTSDPHTTDANDSIVAAADSVNNNSNSIHGSTSRPRPHSEVLSLSVSTTASTSQRGGVSSVDRKSRIGSSDVHDSYSPSSRSLAVSHASATVAGGNTSAHSSPLRLLTPNHPVSGTSSGRYNNLKSLLTGSSGSAASSRPTSPTKCHSDTAAAVIITGAGEEKDISPSTAATPAAPPYSPSPFFMNLRNSRAATSVHDGFIGNNASTAFNNKRPSTSRAQSENQAASTTVKARSYKKKNSNNDSDDHSSGGEGKGDDNNNNNTIYSSVDSERIKNQMGPTFLRKTINTLTKTLRQSQVGDTSGTGTGGVGMHSLSVDDIDGVTEAVESDYSKSRKVFARSTLMKGYSLVVGGGGSGVEGTARRFSQFSDARSSVTSNSNTNVSNYATARRTSTATVGSPRVDEGGGGALAAVATTESSVNINDSSCNNKSSFFRFGLPVINSHTSPHVSDNDEDDDYDDTAAAAAPTTPSAKVKPMGRRRASHLLLSKSKNSVNGGGGSNGSLRRSPSKKDVLVSSVTSESAAAGGGGGMMTSSASRKDLRITMRQLDMSASSLAAGDDQLGNIGGGRSNSNRLLINKSQVAATQYYSSKVLGSGLDSHSMSGGRSGSLDLTRLRTHTRENIELVNGNGGGDYESDTSLVMSGGEGGSDNELRTTAAGSKSDLARSGQKSLISRFSFFMPKSNNASVGGGGSGTAGSINKSRHFTAIGSDLLSSNNNNNNNNNNNSNSPQLTTTITNGGSSPSRATRRPFTSSTERDMHTAIAANGSNNNSNSSGYFDIDDTAGVGGEYGSEVTVSVMNANATAATAVNRDSIATSAPYSDAESVSYYEQQQVLSSKERISRRFQNASSQQQLNNGSSSSGEGLILKNNNNNNNSLFSYSGIGGIEVETPDFNMGSSSSKTNNNHYNNNRNNKLRQTATASMQTSTQGSNVHSASVTAAGNSPPLPSLGPFFHRQSLSFTNNGNSANPVTYTFMTNQDETPEVFELDADLKALRSHVTDEFLNTFSLGLQAYLNGDWLAARVHLEAADRLMREATAGSRGLGLLRVMAVSGDGPSLTLLRFMAESEWTAPKDWKGYRPLTSK